MAPLLLVVGALMSGAGVYAVIYGYSIIQLEQGWASVISGATLVAGGVVTIALGLVLRVLKQVRTGLLDMPARAQPAQVQSEANASAPDAITTEAAPDLLAVPPIQHEKPTSAFASRPRQAEPSFSPSAAQDTGRTAPAAFPEAAYEPPASYEPPAPSVFATTEPTEAANLADLAGHGQPFAAEASPIPPADPPPDIEAPRPADDYKLETPSTAEHDLLPPDRYEPAKAAEEPASPAMDDWLDRAFAELDRDNPPLPPRKPEPRAGKATPTPAIPKSSDPMTLHSTSVGESSIATLEHDAAEPAQAPFAAAEPTQSSSPPPSPQQPSEASPSAIIGRYESDGTTYVMFADGSIEAQSASGVYRFASMAELKAYIEN